MITPDLTEFLSHSLSQKEVSLIVARYPEKTIRILETEGFVNLQNPRDIELSGKRYIWVSTENAKEVYDLALQYGTGQISMYDEITHKPFWINPKYKNNAVVLVVDKRALVTIEDSGLPLRSVAGLALQTA